MATLKQLSNQRVISPTPEFSIGRDPASSLHLPDPLVSSQHASLRWNGTGWSLRDLASKNGTFLDGERVATGTPIKLRVGARLAFGNEQEVFEVLDIAPPQARAVNDAGLEVVGEHGMLILPDSESPEVTIFVTEVGTWLAEENDGTRAPVSANARVLAGGQSWRVDVPIIMAPTVKSDDVLFGLHSSMLRFHVSRDEETVSVELVHRGRTRALPARAHLYLLLVLARARMEDRSDPDLPESEHGWRHIEELLDLLKMDEGAFNVSIYRARKQFAKAEIQGATEIVERRKGARTIRIGVAQLEVVE